MMEGPNKLRCWTKDREQREMPETFKNCKVTPQVTVKSIWLMNGQAGVLFQCSDVIVEEQEIRFSFD